MKTLITPSIQAPNILSVASIAQLSEDNISTQNRFMAAALPALPPKDPTPKDPAIAALLQSLNASTKFRQRANGNRRARRSIRVKRMYPKGYIRNQKHAKGFGWKLTQTTNPPNHPHHPDHPNHPNHPHHPHHPNCPDDSKVLRSHAAQTAIDRYNNADSLGDAIQPTFTQIASSLPTGSAPADLSMGWDGTLWAIDEQGAPHIYDPINDEWNVHGEGIDAAAAIGETFYHFRGNQYVTVNLSTFQTSIPLPITTIATNPSKPLPRSFQLGITGAATVGNTLYLFHGGRYWPVDGSHDPLKLTDIPGWPASAANWQDGVIDAAYMTLDADDQITLRHGNEALYLKFTAGQGFQVVGGPTTVDQLEQTINAGTQVPNGEYPKLFYYSGVTLLPLGDPDPSAPPYIPTVYSGWPATWNPVLAHAPSGRMGNLWCATKDGNFVHHNGESWSLALPDAQATSVSVGNDNSVWMAHNSPTASFPGVYTVGAGGNGIPNIFDLQGAEDRSFAFDYDGSGKQDHLVFYRTGNSTAGTGKIVIVKNNGDGTFTQRYPAPGTTASTIGGYSFDDPGDPLPDQPGNFGFAFDYRGIGKLDHLVFYRPGTGAIYILENQGGTFKAAYQMDNFSGDPNTGIGGYDLRQSPDRGFAFDYDGSGKLDHLVFYRPGSGAIFIIKNQGGSFTPVYQQAGHGNGIGGFDLMQRQDKGFAYDYDGTGKLDHLVFYRPGAGEIFILKNNSGSFTAVYKQPGKGNAIGDFGLTGQYDQGFAFDYKGTGKQNYLVFYSPASLTDGKTDLIRGKISILQNFNGNFINVYPQGQTNGSIGGFDLARPEDLGFSFDATGSGHQNGLVFYRPGEGAIFILKTELNNNPVLGGWANGSFTEHQQPTGGISQVAVGDASRVWVRDGQNNVMQYDGQNYTQNTQVGTAAHIGANNDGTLWHCNNTPDAHRLVSEATAPSQQLSVNTAVTSVQRVATTGFGSSHCLTQHSDGTQGIYRYDSPYVFKTSESYMLAPGSVATGLGKIYAVSEQPTGSMTKWSGQIVALDQHTGEEVVSSSKIVDSIYQYNNPVVDPLRGLVYVTTQGFNNDPHGGQLLAFDAQTLALKWSYATPYEIKTPPALDGNRLCFGDVGGNIYMFDTSTFSNAAPPTRWTYQLTGSVAFNQVAPAIVGNRVYVGYFNFLGDVGNVCLVILDATSGKALPSTPLALGLGTAGYLENASVIVNSVGADVDLEVFIPYGGGVYIVKPFASSPQILSFNMPPGNYLTTALTYDDGSRVGQTSAPAPSQRRLWFGDNVGQLWSIEWNGSSPAPQATDGTPLQVYQNARIFSQPTLYKDSNGGLNVLFGLAALNTSNVTEVTNLLIYVPDSRTYSILPTGVTSIGALSRLSPVDNGVLYAGGAYSSNDPSQVLQVFGIRVDMLVQGLRDFIIESQMMQDPDENAPGGSTDPNNPIPPSVNRYQTHLTVVDDKKSPRAKEALKIWADKPNTQITLGGFSGNPSGPNGGFNSTTNTYTCTIGPDDGDFVSVSAGIDGAITIVSDANDMYATPLRVWASFMNSYERIVVNPDQEFHLRVTTAHADASNNDPTQVNLVTTTNYKGTTLFSSDEVTAGQPAQTATAVGQMKQGLNIGGTNTSTRLSYSRLMQGSRLVPHSPEGEQLATTAQAYTAYTDLHGMGYFATNVPSQRPVTPVQSVGFIFTSGFTADNQPAGPNAPSTKATIQTCSHSDALNEIDTWTGDAWQPSNGGAAGMLQGRRRLGNWWTDFWNWLSNAVETVLAFVQKVVTAIGDAVMVGINMIVNGIEQVFHCKIQFLEDIAAAIGSFFNMLEKVLSDVLEALSVLFQFGEIIKTQKMIKAFLVDHLLNLENTINTNVIPNVQSKLKQVANNIDDLFAIIQTVPNTAISQQQAIANQPQTQGDFATPHTIATVKSQDGSSSSQAVQSNYGTQKMKSGMPSATIASTYAQALGDDNPFIDFLSGFVTNDVEKTISDNFADLQSQLSSNFSSPSSFFDSLLQDFLEILADLVETVFGIAQDLIVGTPGDSTANPPVPPKPGLLQFFSSLITYLIGTDGNSGILGNRIEIPVITWLFELIFQEELSFLNLITFVVAIPVTVLFKVITGKYPSETTLPTAISTATVDAVGSPLVGLWDIGTRTICGVTYAFLSLVGGIASFFSDALEDTDPIPVAFVGCVTSLACIPLSLPYTTTGSPQVNDWVEFGLTVGGYLAGIGFAVWSVNTELDAEAAGETSAGAIAFYSLVSLMVYCIIFHDNDPDPGTWDNVSFAASLLAWINGIVNPLKFIPEVKPVILLFDLALPLTSGIMTAVDYIDANLTITVKNYITANAGYSVVLVQGGSVIATLENGTATNPSSTSVDIDPTQQLICQQQSTSNPTSITPICSVAANTLLMDSTVLCGNQTGGEGVQCGIKSPGP